MKEYTKIRVGLKAHLPQIKGAPLSYFIWMSTSCDRCGMFFQHLDQVSKGTGYSRQALMMAAEVLKQKKFIKSIATFGKSQVFWIMKHDPKVEGMVQIKGPSYLIENSMVLRNLGLKKGDLTCG